MSVVKIEGPNTVIQNNTSTQYRGGGICIDDSDVNIDGTIAGGVTIDNNTGGNYGGGIGAFNTNLELTNVTTPSSTETCTSVSETSIEKAVPKITTFPANV